MNNNCRYFSASTNPLGFPRVWKEYKKLTKNTFEWLYLTVTERHNMNRWEFLSQSSWPINLNKGGTTLRRRPWRQLWLHGLHKKQSGGTTSSKSCLYVIRVSHFLQHRLFKSLQKQTVFRKKTFSGKRNWLSTRLGGLVWQVMAALQEGLIDLKSQRFEEFKDTSGWGFVESRKAGSSGLQSRDQDGRQSHRV